MTDNQQRLTTQRRFSWTELLTFTITVQRNTMNLSCLKGTLRYAYSDKITQNLCTAYLPNVHNGSRSAAERPTSSNKYYSFKSNRTKQIIINNCFQLFKMYAPTCMHMPSQSLVKLCQVLPMLSKASLRHLIAGVHIPNYIQIKSFWERSLTKLNKNVCTEAYMCMLMCVCFKVMRI